MEEVGNVVKCLYLKNYKVDQEHRVPCFLMTIEDETYSLPYIHPSEEAMIVQLREILDTYGKVGVEVEVDKDNRLYRINTLRFTWLKAPVLNVYPLRIVSMSKGLLVSSRIEATTFARVEAFFKVHDALYCFRDTMSNVVIVLIDDLLTFSIPCVIT
jgi:hypothetical protein